MSKKNSKQKLKAARKILKFWYNVLLESPLMNDELDRKDYRKALKTIKDYSSE
jgi:hypothetical protein